MQAARTLFYEHGIRAISVDHVAERARSNKMTLYRHFSSKDRLVAEWLRTSSQMARGKWEAVEAAHPENAVARLYALADMMVDEIGNWDRGCPFSNSLAELSDSDHPAREVIADYFRFQRDWLERASNQAGFDDPEAVADALYYLIRGTTAGLAIDDPQEFAKRERRALHAIIRGAVIDME